MGKKIARGFCLFVFIFVIFSQCLFSATVEAWTSSPPVGYVFLTAQKTFSFPDAPIRMTIKIGQVMENNEDSTQNFIVTDVKILNPVGYADELTYDNVDYAYKIVFPDTNPKTLVFTGFCASLNFHTPTDSTVYSFSDVEINKELMVDFLSTTLEAQQNLVWNRIREILESETTATDATASETEDTTETGAEAATETVAGTENQTTAPVEAATAVPVETQTGPGR